MFQITQNITNESGRFLTLAPAKGCAVQFRLDTRGEVWITVMNAAARLQRCNTGRAFPSFTAALAGYKSAKVKSAIELAKVLMTSAR